MNQLTEREIIPVCLGEGIYAKTVHDEQGRLCFVPDPILLHLHQTGQLDLTQLWVAYHAETFSRTELYSIYIGIGAPLDEFYERFPELGRYATLKRQQKANKPKKDGYTVAITVGAWGGCWYKFAYCKVITIGFVSFMFIPRDLHQLFGDMIGKKFLN